MNMSSSRQITITLTPEVNDKFNELKTAHFMTSDAELCRMAINRMYSEWKEEREGFKQFLIDEVEPMVEKILENKEKERSRGD